MPGARTRVKPVSADEPSASDEASLLETHLQRQLEEDIASDAYTECDIKGQEREILAYLNETFNGITLTPNNSCVKKDDSEEVDVFLTPKCISPYVEKASTKSVSSSPSTELTKEYYALVPVEGNLLEKELIEQDVLLSAFKSIIRTQSGDLKKVKSTHCNKPTSLSLTSSHTPKTVKHSNSCDILFKCYPKDSISENIKTNDKIPNCAISDICNNIYENKIPLKSSYKSESLAEKILEPAYSPDSLITDDPSSSSDYLSAAYTFSPGAGSSVCVPQLNVGDSITKMDNAFTSSDSGLENTGQSESFSSHKDAALTDLSLTESTLHDLTIDDTHYSMSSPIPENSICSKVKIATSSNETPASQSSKYKEIGACKSSKEEKQRQNEEIVILESSSLSSETGSWESVFPPKIPERVLCEKFINKERQYAYEEDVRETLSPSLVQKSPFKSTSCFIDAASLADEEDDTIKIQIDAKESKKIIKSDVIPTPSQPVSCSTVKADISPNDWSESNDNEDSLEQTDNKDPDSIQKDLSPTIFEMTPITEDSLCANTFEEAAQAETDSKKISDIESNSSLVTEKAASPLTSTVYLTSTPYNSIMSVKMSTLKHFNQDESRIDSSLSGHDSLGSSKKLQKFNESSPIVSGGASIEDYLPQSGSHSDSPVPRRRIENIPIVSGAYIPPTEENKNKKSPKPSSASAWVVDMSSSAKSDIEKSASTGQFSIKKPGDRACESLKNESRGINIPENINKSRSSLDSDSSERSSHKFYIDLSSLPDPLPPKNDNENDNSAEKKNIFSMYIDLGDKSTLKEMPARLSCSLNSKKNNATENVTPKKAVSKSMTNETVQNANESNPTHNANKDDNGTGIFEQYELLCDDLNISISAIISCPDSKNVSTEVKNSYNSADVSKKENITRTDKTSFSRDNVIQEEPSNEQTGDLFVKLSDLDKPAPKSDIPVITTVQEEVVPDVRMTRSIPDTNWGNQSNNVTRPVDVISSFHSENALSLNRLFPHLKNEFSKSLPGSLSSRTRSRVASSRGDMEEQVSDVSELSSVQSSMCRSVVENSTTEDTSQTSSLIGFCQSRLGQDLLRMFLEEITPDVIVEVSGRRIKAHKCILSSRCQYFARILSGGWVESAGNVIVLPPFSFNVVHFALCHIYSGMSTIPDSISIVELATLADMLGLEGLKEAIMFTLKAKYCHHFHRPCAVCTAGVLECFPLSSVYSLDDLYRKCLKWITKYFSRVWPTKAFATLPKELLDKCYQQHLVNLTTDNLVDTVYGCGITVASLQNSRWAESVARMCRRLVNAAAHFAAVRLCDVFRALAAAPARAPPPALQALHDCLAAAIEWAPPDEACRTYAFLSGYLADLRMQYAKPDLITDNSQGTASENLLGAHATGWRLQCEGALVRAAPRAVSTQAFKELPPELRKRLRELGCIMYGAQAVPASSPLQDRTTRSAYHTRAAKVSGALASRSLDIDQVRASFVPYAPKPAAHVGSTDVLKSSTDLRDRKSIKFTPPKIRTTKAQEERAKFNMAKTNHQSQDRLSGRGNPRVQSFENTKPRYLEPRTSKEGDRQSTATKKLMNRMVSSSESSRNSSPIQARNARASRQRSRAGAAPQPAMSQDSLATTSRPRTAEPSTDSLSESQTTNKYATYTKRKYTSKGSVESISSKYQNVLHSVPGGNKIKTKIPVYLNQNAKTSQATKQANESQKRPNQANKAPTNTTAANGPRNKVVNERKVPGSLMNATKSSSAKMVPKISKEKPVKCNARLSRGPAKHTSRQEMHEQASEIPVMQRSGTFLKDEPTFGDITTNIDVDQ